MRRGVAGAVVVLGWLLAGGAAPAVAGLSELGAQPAPVSDVGSDGLPPRVASVGGVPHVAYEQPAGTLRVERYDRASGTWTELPSAGLPAGSFDVRGFALFDQGGTPCVAYDDATAGGNDDVVLVRCAGPAGWSALGSGPVRADDDTGVYYVRDALVVGGVPYVLWVDSPFAGATALRLSALQGGTWTTVDAGGLQRVGADAPRIGDARAQLAEIGGKVHAAWSQVNTGGTSADVYVSRLESPGAVLALGAAVSPAEGAQLPRDVALADDGGRVVVG